MPTATKVLPKDKKKVNDCVIAKCGGCGRVVFAAVNEPSVMDAEMFKEIGELVKAGCSIEHVETEEVRRAAFGCKCDKEGE